MRTFLLRSVTSRPADQLLAFGFGVCFIFLLIALAVAIPEPTVTTFFVFRVVLAIAAAGFVAAIPGMLHINLARQRQWQIRAGGALAAFALIYTVNPAPLVNPNLDPGLREWSVVPSQITQGQGVTIRWDVAKADQIRIDPLGAISNSEKGEITDMPERDTEYRLLVPVGSYHLEVGRPIRVRVSAPEPGAPVIESFKVSPQEVVRGQEASVVVSWRVKDASEIEIREAKIRTIAPEGDEAAQAPLEDTQYVIHAFNNSTNKRATAVATVRVVTATPTPTPVPARESAALPQPTPTPIRMEHSLRRVTLEASTGCISQVYTLTPPDPRMVIDKERGDGGHAVNVLYFSRNYTKYGPSVPVRGDYRYSVKDAQDALGRAQKILTVVLCATERTPPPLATGKFWVAEQLVFDFVLYARTP